LAQAVTLMLRSHASALSIFADDSSIVGMVIEGDLQEHRELEIEKHRAQWKEFLFGQVKRESVHIDVDSRCFLETKTCDATTFSEVENLWAVFDFMKRNNIRRLPVMMGDRLLGILVGANLIGVLTILTPASDHPARDENTRNSILAALGHRGQASRAIGGVDAPDKIQLIGGQSLTGVSAKLMHRERQWRAIADLLR
jgi:CBS domain-containing protein